MIENLSAIAIGERIGQKLTELNLKQKDLIMYTDLSKNAVSNYVSGKRVPDTLSVYKISVALGVSIEWLLTGEYSTSTHSTTSINSSSHNCKPDDTNEGIWMLVTPDEKYILELIRKLPTRDQAKVEGNVEDRLKEMNLKNAKVKSSAYPTGQKDETSSHKLA